MSPAINPMSTSFRNDGWDKTAAAPCPPFGGMHCAYPGPALVDVGREGIPAEATPAEATPAAVDDDAVDPNAPKKPIGKWAQPRVARLGFLIGQGLTAARVARDPLVASTTHNVHRQARRFGLAFREAVSPIRMSRDAKARVAAAAARRGVTPEALCQLLLAAATSQDALIDNILDDGA